MIKKYFILFIISCVSVVITSKNILRLVNGKIKLTIGTTSGCGDTVDFFENQLSPTYTKYKKFLNIEFVPWGRTVRAKDGTLICYFGEEDCWANRLHRCVLDSLKKDQDAQVRYMVCEFSDPYPAFSDASYQCAEEFGLTKEKLDYCMTSSGDHLERVAEDAAAKPIKILDFVPTVVFNNKINVKLHNAALEHLHCMVCHTLAKDPTTNITKCTRKKKRYEITVK